MFARIVPTVKAAPHNAVGAAAGSPPAPGVAAIPSASPAVEGCSKRDDRLDAAPTFARTVDLLQVVVEFLLAPSDLAPLLAFRGVSSTFDDALQAGLRQRCRDANTTWAEANRLAPFATVLPRLVRLCVVAGGRGWLTELPPIVDARVPPDEKKETSPEEEEEPEPVVVAMRCCESVDSVSLTHPGEGGAGSLLRTLCGLTMAAHAKRRLRDLRIFGMDLPVGHTHRRQTDAECPSMAELLQHLTGLTSLRVEDCRVADASDGDLLVAPLIEARGAQLRHLGLDITSVVHAELFQGAMKVRGAITVETIKRLGRCCKHLESFRVTHLPPATRLSPLLNGCRELQALEFRFAERVVNDDVLVSVGAQLRSLCSIDLDRCNSGVTQKGFDALVHGCRNLESVSLRAVFGLEMPAVVASLATVGGSLRALELVHVSGVTPLVLLDVCRRLPLLASLAVTLDIAAAEAAAVETSAAGGGGAPAMPVTGFAEHATQLTALNLSFAESDPAEGAAPRAPRIRVREVHHLATRCFRLRHLTLPPLVWIRKEAASAVRAVADNCGELRTLCIPLINLPRGIDSIPLAVDADDDMDDATLQRQPTTDVVPEGLVDADVSALAARCRSLEVLNIAGHRLLSPGCLEPIARHCKNFKHLYTNDATTFDANFHTVLPMSTLQQGRGPILLPCPTALAYANAVHCPERPLPPERSLNDYRSTHAFLLTRQRAVLSEIASYVVA